MAKVTSTIQEIQKMLNENTKMESELRKNNIDEIEPQLRKLFTFMEALNISLMQPEKMFDSKSNF